MAIDNETEGNSKNCSSSPFLLYLRQCYDCAKGMKNETAFANYIQTMIDECVLGEPLTASESTSTTGTTSTTSTTSTTGTTGQTPASTSALTTQTSATQTSTTQTSTTHAQASAAQITGSSQSSTPSPGSHSNTSTIVPAVVVPVVAVLAAVILFFFIKRRQRKRSSGRTYPELDGSSPSKELEGTKVVNEMQAAPIVKYRPIELPAEEVATEMGANREKR